MKTAFTILFLFGISLNSYANKVEKINIGKKLTLYSTVLQEDREYWVGLPDGYTKSKKYPVVYLLDGRNNFHTASAIFKHMYTNGILPEMILVAITNTDRTRDLTPSFSQLSFLGTVGNYFPTSGGAKHFLQFIENELMPNIESIYSTHDYNMIVGHSFGALFSLYALIENPTLFQSVISIDPSLWWDYDWLNKKLIQKIGEKPLSSMSLFIAAANNPAIKGFPKSTMLGQQEEFFSEISKWKSENYNVTFEYFADESHDTIPLIALFKGISSIFKGFKLPNDMFVDDPSLLAKHYDDWSKKLGYKLTPSEKMISQIANELLWLNEVQKSIYYFEINVKNHPNIKTYNNLAKAYMKNSQHKLAIENYEKVLKIDAHHKSAKKQLKKLYAEKFK